MEAIAKHDFTATAEDELSFRRSQVLKVGTALRANDDTDDTHRPSSMVPRWTRCAASRRIAAVTGLLHETHLLSSVRPFASFVRFSPRTCIFSRSEKLILLLCRVRTIGSRRARKLLRLHARYLCMFTTARSDNNFRYCFQAILKAFVVKLR